MAQLPALGLEAPPAAASSSAELRACPCSEASLGVEVNIPEKRHTLMLMHLVSASTATRASDGTKRPIERPKISR